MRGWVRILEHRAMCPRRYGCVIREDAAACREIAGLSHSFLIMPRAGPAGMRLDKGLPGMLVCRTMPRAALAAGAG